MASAERSYRVVVVGGGPAGLAAAAAAAVDGVSVALLERQSHLGGALWSHHPADCGPAPAARRWRRRLERHGVDVFTESTVLGPGGPGRLIVEGPGEAWTVRYDHLVLAVGARERFLPFPGWTLPNVLGVGGLQVLAKAGWPVAGRRIVVAGTGPLLLAAAAQLRRAGGRVVCIAEQARMGRLARFALHLPGLSAAKCAQALGLSTALWGVPLRTGCWVTAAGGTDTVESVTLRQGARRWEEPCDLLACAFGLLANTELPRLLGCRCRHGTVEVDPLGRTSVPGIWCAGEPTGIGGLQRALLAGTLAGRACVGRSVSRWTRWQWRRAQRFSDLLDETFVLDPALRDLVTPETVVCRCEDVTAGDLAGWSDGRQARRHTRCGMGPCQGRTCGAITEFLYGWHPTGPRPPVLPARLDSLAELPPADTEGVPHGL